ncbi:MAG: glutathione S-transferase [Polaromonas sp.]|jgi:glutathione S-transferase|nr:glutathione S-transferase [Polaromonas sp.]MBP6156533.1 glutathione S-transferase [Polaromonas sp.]MBP7114843.1 glutathione S-transferase [Polaromonas sp.]MBP9831756.1 glutathione S-transferase [Polaromonas sp.]
MTTEVKPPSGKLPILYSFRRCPFAMRARLALLTSGIQSELREVVLRNKPTEFLATSPKGTVPVLVTTQGEVIEQSWDIMLWALRQHDPAQWLPSDAKVFERGMQLLHRCDGEFKQLLDRYKYPKQHGLEDGTGARNEALFFLANLESLLTQQRYLFNSNIGIFDAAILPFIRQFSHVDIDWFAAQPLPSVQAWLSAFEHSADFKRAMTVYPAWADNSPITVFP